MASLAEIFVRVGADITEFKKGMQTMQKQMGDIGSNMQQAGSEVATVFGGMGAAIGAGLGLAVNTAMNFEAQMSRVGAIAGASSGELQKMRDAALQLGASTSKSAGEVAIGMENMAAMGFTVNEVLAAMPGVISAAEASGEDMALVADVVASSLRSFGLEASESTRIADVLAQTANISAAGIQDMAYTMKYAAPVANSLGVSIEELSAATAIMANTGIRGEMAGTTLRSALGSLADPTDNAALLMQQLGIKTQDANGNLLPFQSILGDLTTGLHGMGTAQKSAALKTIFGESAVSGMLAVIDAGPEKFAELTKSLENSGGASAKTAEQMKDNLKGAMDELGGAFETAQITIGNALTPAIQALAAVLQTAVDWFNKMPKGMQKAIAIGAAVAAVILILVGVIGGLVAFVGAVISGFAAMMPVLAGVGAVFTVLTGPIGIIIAIVAALIAIVVLLYKNWDKISVWFKKSWERTRAVFGKNIQAITALLSGLGKLAKVWGRNLIGGFVSGIKGKIGDAKEAVKTVIGGVKSFLGFNSPAEKGEGRYIEHWGANMVSGFSDGVKSALPGLKSTLGNAFSMGGVNVAANQNLNLASDTRGEKTPQQIQFNPLQVNITGDTGQLNVEAVARAVEAKIVKSIGIDSRRIPNRMAMSGVR